jgi:adenine phosphoribosyltransferase
MDHMAHVRALIRDVPDFPVPGIVFKDITPVLQDPHALSDVINELARRQKKKGVQGIVGIESRGFIIGTPLAMKLSLPFIPVRKEGKLPCDKIKTCYSLEYGKATIEMHKDAIKPGQKIVIVDDLLATGGTAAATIDLVEKLGGEVVSCAFVIELGFLKGRDKLPKGKCDSLITY